jgi:vacuolar-type H+-ATPase subunit H
VTTSQNAKGKVQQTAAAANEEGKKVADTARTEIQEVAAEARTQVSGLRDEALAELNEQSRTQRDRLVRTSQEFADDLEQMASQGGRPGLATDLARQVAGRARGLSSQVDGREPAELLDELRRFARRKPGVFLLGALTAGMVAGRLARGAKAANDGNDSLEGGDLVATSRGDAGTFAATPVPASGLVAGSPMGDPLTDPLNDDLPERSAP